MKTKLSFIFILFISCILSLGAHPVYISMTNIEYLPENNQLLLAVKLDQNDLLSLIQVKYGYHFQQTKEFSQRENELIELFLTDQLFIKADTSLLTLHMTGSTRNGDNIWVLFSTTLTEKTTSFQITNNLFLYAFSEQKNLVIFVCADYQKGIMFDKQNLMQHIHLPTITSTL